MINMNISFNLTQKEVSTLKAYTSRDNLKEDLMHIHVWGNKSSNILKISVSDRHRLFWIEKEYKKGQSKDFYFVIPNKIGAGEITLTDECIINNGNSYDYLPLNIRYKMDDIIPRLDSLWFTDVEESYMRHCFDALSGNVNPITNRFTFNIKEQCLSANNEDEFFKSSARVEFMYGLKETRGHLNYDEIHFNLGFWQKIFKYKKSSKKFRIFWPETPNKPLTIMDLKDYGYYMLMPTM